MDAKYPTLIVVEVYVSGQGDKEVVPETGHWGQGVRQLPPRAVKRVRVAMGTCSDDQNKIRILSNVYMEMLSRSLYIAGEIEISESRDQDSVSFCVPPWGLRTNWTSQTKDIN